VPRMLAQLPELETRRETGGSPCQRKRSTPDPLPLLSGTLLMQTSNISLSEIVRRLKEVDALVGPEKWHELHVSGDGSGCIDLVHEPGDNEETVIAFQSLNDLWSRLTTYQWKVQKEKRSQNDH